MKLMKKRSKIGLGLAAALILVGQGCAPAAVQPTLDLSQATYEPGEQILVTFTAPDGYDTSAWIGVVPKDTPHGDEEVNDQFDTDYEYLNEETSGSVTLTAPSTPGQYDVRMHDNDIAGNEVASVTFAVVAPEGGVEPTLSLDETSYSPGERITVSFTAPATYDSSAWIGLIPSDVPHGDEVVNDANDLEYEYLSNKTSGTVSFVAPDEAGSYDLRMNDNDAGGVEVASVTFTVE